VPEATDIPAPGAPERTESRGTEASDLGEKKDGNS
jgi:hypothetical protein